MTGLALAFENKRLPEGWVSVIFKYLIKKIPLTDKKIKQKEYLKKGTIPIIDQGQEFIGGYTEDTKRIVNCNLPVIVFGDHTKSIKFIDREFVAGADGIKVLEPNSCINQKLLYYFMQAIQLPDNGYARHYQYLEKAIMCIPPLNEQHRIVSKIESIFAQIDAAKERLEALISQTKSAAGNLNELRRSVLKHAFEGKLVSQDPNDELAEFLLKAIHKNLEMDTEQNNLPKNWITFQYSKYLKIDYGKSIAKKYRSSNDNFPIYGSSGVIGFSNTFLVKNPCLIIGRKGAAGKTHLATTPSWPIDTTYYLVDFPMYDQKFLYFLFEQMNLSKLDSSTAIPSLRRNDIYSLSMILPPIAEQKRIVSKIESIFGNIDSIEKQVNDAIRSLNTLKQSVLKLAFEGKLVPQDPNDEPASVLLGKIKLQKK